MNVEEYRRCDATQLAMLLRNGEVSSETLMRHAFALADLAAKRFNALSYRDDAGALRELEQASRNGYFAGVPFLLKDSALASRRLPSSLGSHLFDDTHYAYDATLTTRFRELGLIAFGRTTVPELCMAPTTEAVRNGGPTLNPWDKARSCGGSSGGAAVAVCSGVVPIAHGSDGGGSIRIPAACCGVFGLKPSRGLIPAGPHRGEIWGGLATDGVLSRSVRDSAAVLDGIAGMEVGAPYAAPARIVSYLDAVEHAGSGARMTIHIWDGIFGVDVDPVCVDALHDIAELCRRLGHTVHATPAPDLDFESFVQAQIDILAAHLVAAVDARCRILGRDATPGDLEPAIADGYMYGKTLSAARYTQALQEIHAVGYVMQRAAASSDLVMTPTLTRLPAFLGELTATGTFTSFRKKVARYTAFLAVINASGQPAANVPVYWDEGGLPVGIQLIGSFGREDLILRLSAELEGARPWWGRYY